VKIGLLDIDSHNFPNLALMKISAWHKSINDEVEMYNQMFEYDKVYASKIFTFSNDYYYPINANEVIKGGFAYNNNVLPDYIEKIYPDYSLYNIQDTAYGYLTRGCPLNCKFCIVSQKEGMKSVKVANLKDFWNGQKYIKLLDPNLLACKDKYELLEQLQDSKANIDFTQGLDIRFMNDKIADYLNKIKIKNIHFAWDNPYDKIVYSKLKHFRNKLKYDYTKLTVYVLTNFNTIFKDDLKRVYKLKKIGYNPYIMIYNKDKAGKEYKKLQRWVNNRYIFRSCEKFEDYE
jgi:hypothetical protein